MEKKKTSRIIPNPKKTRLKAPIFLQQSSNVEETQNEQILEGGIKISELSSTESLSSSDIFVLSRQNDGIYNKSLNVQCQIVTNYISEFTKNSILTDCTFLSALSSQIKSNLLSDEEFIMEIKKKIVGTVGYVQFQTNYGRGEEQSKYQQYTIDEEFRLSSIAELGFEKEGYDFQYWFDEETGETYEDYQLTAFHDGVTRLKGIWNSSIGDISYFSAYPEDSI